MGQPQEDGVTEEKPSTPVPVEQATTETVAAAAPPAPPAEETKTETAQ